MKVAETYYIIDGKLYRTHGQQKGNPLSPPIFAQHKEGEPRKPLALDELVAGKKFRYGAVPAGYHDLHGYETKFGYQPRHVYRFEGEPADKGQYFYIDLEAPNCDCYVAISELLSVETQQVYVPSDFVWGERGYIFVPGNAVERPADGNPAKYELPFTKITVELKLHGRAKFEVATEVNENSMRIYRVYEPL